ncbi:hypothetical protein QBC39DRAFT_375074 [Podospora conica]|nr:hypothetical protein QBC39DRAFT_375074 [Schizothecium conicum]
MLWLRALLTASLLLDPPHVNALDVDSAQNDGSCQNVALDYADSGSYLIDANSEGNFKYASMFQGDCRDNEIISTIKGPTGREYQCSTTRPSYDGDIQISECTIPYAFMSTGKWQIIINLSPSVILTRTFTLTVSALDPSITYPSAAPSPKTTTTLPQATITTRCAPSLTQTVTARGPQGTTTETHNVIVRATGPRETLTSLTTATVTPECRFPVIYTTRTTTPRPPTSTTPKPAATTTPKQPLTTITILPATTPAPTLPRPNGAAGAYYFTMSGSTCMLNLGGAGAPPQWITSLWRGGVPPALTTGGALPAFVTCVRLAAAGATSTRRKRDAGAWETRVRVERGVAATETVRVTPAPRVVCQDVGGPAMVTVTAGRMVTVVVVETLTTVVTETVVVTATEKVVATGTSIDAAAASCWGEGGQFGVWVQP